MTGPRDDELERDTPADELAGRLGVPRSEWNARDIVDLARELGVRMVSLMHVGGDGWLKTLDFAPRSADHLLDIVQGGERADGSSLFGGAGLSADASDVVLRPRASTAFLDPFAERPTLALLCGHHGRDGQPLPQSPDTILRRACSRLQAQTGLELTALGEIEFFLGKPHDPTDFYGRDERGYHALAPFVFGQRLRRRAMHVLTTLGIPVKYGHSEVGYIQATGDETLWEQHEIELSLQRLPDAADSVLLTQWVLRLLARREGMRCSTAPMMASGHAGNGLHLHLSPYRDGRHLEVSDGQGELTDASRALVGGLVLYGAPLMAYGNCNAESYARLTQGKEAPGGIRWGHYDRSALVRIPVVPRDDEGRAVTEPTVEFRLPDGSALVHLLLAGVAQATVAASTRDDLQDVLQTTAATSSASGEGSRGLPQTPGEVADALERDRQVLERGEVFPAGMIEARLARLRAL